MVVQAYSQAWTDMPGIVAGTCQATFFRQIFRLCMLAWFKNRRLRQLGTPSTSSATGYNSLSNGLGHFRVFDNV